MDAEQLQLVTTASTALVQVLATDSWELAKSAVAALWRRVHPERVAGIEAELEDARAEILVAREGGDGDAESNLSGDWERKFRRLISANPELAHELQKILEETLSPALPSGRATNQAIGGSVFTVNASGNARVYQAHGDQNFNDR